MKNESDNNKVVVLADGAFPRHTTPLTHLCEADIVVCCDRAYLKWKAYIQGHIVQAKTVYVVGDGDSLPLAARCELGDRFIQIADQECNDLSKSVQFCFANGWYAPVLLGTTGLREDHTLGNISLLMEYMQQGLYVRMYTDHGVFIPCQGETTLACHPGQQVSLFNFGAKKLLATHLRYPIRDFTSWWQGTLNECTSTTFTIHAEGDYLVFLNY